MYYAEIPGLEFVFTTVFIGVARWYGKATFAATEWAKGKLNIAGGSFAYLLAVIIDVALVAATKYLGVGAVVAILAMVGITIPLPAFPGGIPPNVFWIALVVVSIADAGLRYLKLGMNKIGMNKK